MDQRNVFAGALGWAGTPLGGVDVTFDKELKRLDTTLDYPPGSLFPHPSTGRPLSTHDSAERS